MMEKNKQNEENKQEQLQQKYMEFQFVEQQVKKLQQQLQTFEQQLSELATVKEALDELKKVKSGTEILLPLSTGIFLKAHLQSVDSLLVNVGSNTAVEKPLSQTKVLLLSQETELLTYKDRVMENVNLLQLHMTKLQEELQALVQETSSKEGTA